MFFQQQRQQPKPFVNSKDIPNFATVSQVIVRGGAPSKQGLEALKRLGIKHIVDLRIERKGQKEEDDAARALGLKRTRIPMGREAPTATQEKLFLQIIRNASKEPVFIHCQHGADRTGAMIGIYRVTDCRWTFDQAYAEMRKYGFKTFLSELKNAVRKRVW